MICFKNIVEILITVDFDYSDYKEVPIRGCFTLQNEI